MSTDAGPRATCALRKGSEGWTCDHPQERHPCHPLWCKYGGARPRPHRAVLCALSRRISQAGGCADRERHIPELYDLAEAAARCRTCAQVRDYGCLSCFPGVLHEFWIDVSVRCPHAERCMWAPRRNQEMQRDPAISRRRSDTAQL